MTCSKMYGILREVGVSVSLEQVTEDATWLNYAEAAPDMIIIA